MFQNNKNLIKLAPEIYVYKNFLSKEETESFRKYISKFPENHWLNKDMWQAEDEISAPNQIFQGSLDLDILYKKSQSFFGPEYKPLPSNGVSKMVEGQSLEVHWDSPGHPDDHDEESMDAYNSAILNGELYDPHNTCHIVQYGYVMYMNDFEGGELYYPEVGVEYKPESGDLVIHSASKKYRHGVRTVTKGPRYAYTNFIVASEQNVPTLSEYFEPEFNKKMMKEAIDKNINAPLWEKNFID
jgi:hypothetical protein